MGEPAFFGEGRAFKQWLRRQREIRARAVNAFPCVNIRAGHIVGTDSPDTPDGTYVRIDHLPSKGGKVFNAIIGEHLDSLPVPATVEANPAKCEKCNDTGFLDYAHLRIDPCPKCRPGDDGYKP